MIGQGAWPYHEAVDDILKNGGLLVLRMIVFDLNRFHSLLVLPNWNVLVLRNKLVCDRDIGVVLLKLCYSM